MDDDLNLLKEGIPSDILRQVEDILQPFCLSLETLKKVSDNLMKDIRQGLDGEAPDKMLPTFVRDTPDGTEEGNFLALDLGGTNLRALHVQVKDRGIEILGIEECEVPPHVRDGTGVQLFQFIAEHLSKLLISQGLKDKELPLGFTFSFPCKQLAIDKSILIRCVKGYKCWDAVEKDVGELLKDAIKSKGITIGQMAIVNDTVGIMMSCGYEDMRCDIGMIIGTGTNACYMENLVDGRMCINTEWGCFQGEGFLKEIQTDFDREVDEKSSNPGVHIFEKMISGMYLGEIVQLVLVKLIEDKLLFKGQMSRALQTPRQFETEFISKIEDPESGLKNAEKILGPGTTGLALEVDLRVVRLVCGTISSRAARLCSAALATIATHLRVTQDLNRLNVGVDGALYKYHPKFSTKLQETVRLLTHGCDITFIEKKDGSGKGAAMVTAVVQRLAR